MTLSRYLVLAAVVLTAACGDVCLAVGMKQIGVISEGRWKDLLFAVSNPWVAVGVVLLTGFYVGIPVFLLVPRGATMLHVR